MVKKSWLVKQAEEKGILIGVKINLVVDNSPIDHCFFKEEARRLGFPVVEKTSNEKIAEAIRMSSARLRGG